jgi:pPIWI RE three-gene island domain Z
MFMRERPEIWTGVQRICWLCCLMKDFIGSTSLKEAPALMSGAKSVLSVPALKDASQAIFNLRQIAPAFVTDQSIRYAVALYNEKYDKNESEGPYSINPETLEFQQVGSYDDAAILEAQSILSRPLSYKQRGMAFADPTREMQVQLTDDALSSRVVIPPLPVTPTPPIYHDLTRKPKGKVTVTLDELEKVATEMDHLDSEHPERSKGNWKARLDAIELLLPIEERGLKKGKAITLEGLKHLIGLPGSGKTTLLMLLGVWLGRQKLKTLLLFPSIEVARRYLGDLEFYGVRVGMLVGQSPQTRRRHANKIAESIAAKGNGGFGPSSFRKRR